MSQSSSKKLIMIAVVLVVVIVAASVWFVQRRARPADKVTRVAITMMESDLRGLVFAEEATRRIRGRFVADAEDAGHMSSVGVTQPKITLSDSGYTATVEFKTIPGIRCAVAVYARNPLKRLAKNGEIVCE